MGHLFEMFHIHITLFKISNKNILIEVFFYITAHSYIIIDPLLDKLICIFVMYIYTYGSASNDVFQSSSRSHFLSVFLRV